MYRVKHNLQDSPVKLPTNRTVNPQTTVRARDGTAWSNFWGTFSDTWGYRRSSDYDNIFTGTVSRKSYIFLRILLYTATLIQGEGGRKALTMTTTPHSRRKKSVMVTETLSISLWLSSKWTFWTKSKPFDLDTKRFQLTSPIICDIKGLNNVPIFKPPAVGTEGSELPRWLDRIPTGITRSSLIHDVWEGMWPDVFRIFIR